MEIKVYDEIPSTQELAFTAAREGAKEFYTVLARRQNAGRGRLNRRFLSPPGGTYFSTVLRPEYPAERYVLLTPFAAVCVRRALLSLIGVRADIKWVNDLLLDGKKICGILSGSGIDQNGVPFAVVGIGINTGTELPEEVREFAACAPFLHPEQLCRAILSELSEHHSAVAAGDFLPEYQAACRFLGQPVRIIAPAGEQRVATALSIGPLGELVLREENGEIHAIYGDEISLRPTK